MKIALLVDWLSITLKRWPGPWPFFDLDTAEQVQPRYGYNTAWRDRNGVIAYNGGNSDSLHIVYSGAALNSVRMAGNDIRSMLASVKEAGAKITRLDIAADWQEPGITVVTLANLVGRGDCDIRVKRWNYIESQSGGATLYLGSRSSERMMRIYNKAAEMASKHITTPGEWIRVEVELKDDQAQQAANALLDNELGSVLAAHIAKCVAFPYCQPWQDLIAALPLPTHIMPSARGLTNTDEWLLNSVLPILKRRLNDPEFERLWMAGLTG